MRLPSFCSSFLVMPAADTCSAKLPYCAQTPAGSAAAQNHEVPLTSKR